MKKIFCKGLTALIILGTSTVAFANNAPEPSDIAASVPAAASVLTEVTVAATSDSAVSGGAVTSEPGVTIVPNMTFTGAPIKLSLEDAYKKMLADSPGAQMAELNRQSADGVAKGYGESVQNMTKIERGIDSGVIPSVSPIYWSYDPSNKVMLKANKDYAAAQGPRNYEAELNSLKTSTLKNYYTLKELENQEKIAKDNLVLKEKLLTNTQLKFKLGTVAKNDVLKAEIAVNEARDQHTAAENGLKTMKMAFNQFMGYGLMQNVTLTDTIKEVPLSTQSLENSIKNALKNRNEVFSAAYNLQMANLDFKNYTAYPKNSSKYIKAKMGVLMAETNSKNTPLTIESDVRNKYMAMVQQYNAIQTSKTSVENAKETVRLAQLQYDAGMATLTDVEGAQLGYYNTQLAYSRALLEYNLAVDAYNLSSGVGINTAIIR